MRRVLVCARRYRATRTRSAVDLSGSDTWRSSPLSLRDGIHCSPWNALLNGDELLRDWPFAGHPKRSAMI